MKRFARFVFFVTSMAVIALAASRTSPVEAQPPSQLQEIIDKRTRYVAEMLVTPIKELDKGDVLMPLLLDSISSFLVHPNDRDKRVPICVDTEAFRIATGGQFDIERQPIRFSSKLNDETLATILEIICSQLDAGYVVRKGHIEIVPVPVLRKELNYPFGRDSDFRRLVVRFYDEMTVRKALTDLADKYSRTVLLAPAADKELEKVITARLLNVPFETAVETLADLADLKVVRKANVLLVTTKEQAALLNAEHEKRLQVERDAFAKEKEQEKKMEKEAK
jgi:hypothetical protein